MVGWLGSSVASRWASSPCSVALVWLSCWMTAEACTSGRPSIGWPASMQAADQRGARLRRVAALLRVGDLRRDVGELLVDEARVVRPGDQVVLDLEVGDRRLGGVHALAQLYDFLLQPDRGLGGVLEREIGAALDVGGGDGVGDVGGELRDRASARRSR